MLKVVIVGGGSSYTPELIGGFLERFETFPLSELWLVDIQPERLRIVGGLAQRMVQARDAPFAVHLTTDRREALPDASYVINQIRVGGMVARREDEYLGRRHGLIGQETTGVGGMSKALRTIPVVLDIARDMHELAPDALLVNFANPAGLVTEALARYAPNVPSVGVCNVPITTKMTIVRHLAEETGTPYDPQQAQLDTLGLNHLSWHRGLTLGGENLWPQVIDGYLAQLHAASGPRGTSAYGEAWDSHTIEALGMIPNYYLQYYYYTERKLSDQEEWPPSRAEEVMVVEKALLAQYSEPDRVELSEDLMKRGGAYYSTMATQLLDAHYNDLGEQHVVNLPHDGAVPGWPSDWVLEMPASVGEAGIKPIPADPLPLACFGLLAQVKSYELLTVEAAVYGNRKAAYQALLAHPLGPSADRVQSVLDDMLAIHGAFLPQFR
jgi:6-phospho-beta-glucosidase